MRLDLFLFKGGLAQSRTFAKVLIDGGYVRVNNKVATKASLEVADSDCVEVTGTPYTFVSRGGVKLEAALDSFGISVDGAVCVDIGASSGGFTDCLLRRGAKKVYAVDSGSGQLAECLRHDERVVNIEGFNARELDCAFLGEQTDIAVCDVSFISQTLIIPAVRRVLKSDGIYIGLIKPQFECGRQGLGKGGIVRDSRVTITSVLKVCSFAKESGLSVVGLLASPICGGDGNREFLMLCRTGKDFDSITEEYIRKVCRI